MSLVSLEKSGSSSVARIGVVGLLRRSCGVAAGRALSLYQHGGACNRPYKILLANITVLTPINQKLVPTHARNPCRILLPAMVP